MASNKKLNATLTIGGAVSSTLGNAFSTVKSQLGRLEQDIKSMNRQQNLLTRSITEFGRAGKSIDSLRAKYAENITVIDRLRTAQERLNRATKAVSAAKAKGKPLTLIDGLGNILGDWVIESVEERKSVFAAAGVARKYEFTLTLKFYDESDYSEAQVAAALAMNVAPDVPTAIGAANVGSSTESAMGGLADTLSSARQKISDIASEVTQTVQPAIDAVKRGVTLARTVQNAAKDAQRTIKAIKNINSLSTAQRALDGLRASASNASAIGANLSRAIGGVDKSLTNAGAATSAIDAVRGGLVSVNRVVTSSASVVSQIDNIYKKLS